MSYLNTQYTTCQHALQETAQLQSHVNNELWLNDIILANKIIASGRCNRFGCRIEVPTDWNLVLFEQLLTGYEHREIIEWLRFGFPVSRSDAVLDPIPNSKNHLGAVLYPDTIDKYIETELSYNAIMGPFSIPPFFNRMGISPLSTRPKKNSDKRRVILDLSFPPGRSVNDGIEKSWYCGEYVELTYPSIDTLAERISKILDPLIWKIDLHRAFRQFPLCPRDYSLIGFRWRNLIYFDKRIPMGLRSAAHCCQMVTNAISYIHIKNGYWVTNYLDDFGSAETKDIAWESFFAMRTLLAQLGAHEAFDKACAPSHRVEFLGILFDTQKRTIEIPADKLSEISQNIEEWLHKTFATRKELESIIGKLSFVSKCVRSSRVFLSRLILSLPLFKEYSTEIPQFLKKDLHWWKTFISKYNGVSIMWLLKCDTFQQKLATDASLVGLGAVCDNQFIHPKFPDHVLWRYNNIAHLELFAIIIAIKTWVKLLKGKKIVIQCDNMACVNIVNTGKTRNSKLAELLRELAYFSGLHDIWIKLEYIDTKSNVLPDLLSRWHNGVGARHKFKSITNNKLTRRSVANNLFYITHI